MTWEKDDDGWDEEDIELLNRLRAIDEDVARWITPEEVEIQLQVVEGVVALENYLEEQ